MTKHNELINSEEFISAKEQLKKIIQNGTEKISGIRHSSLNPTESEKYIRLVTESFARRGRQTNDYLFPLISTGFGRGPYLELLDGSVKLDLTSGLGINFFGHSHPILIEEMINSLASDVIQGSLLPGIETVELEKTLLQFVGDKSPLKHCWLSTCGAMANDSALKIIRQKKFPATSVITFEGCFAGRSIAMQEITDKPGNRENQPLYGEVSYIPFYKPELGLEKSIALSINALKKKLNLHPSRFCCLLAELVQVDAGIKFAPAEYFFALLSEAKQLGLAVWIDEIQTFGRTGEFFAYQTLALDQLVDVVTIGKLFQMGALLYTHELNPKPFLLGSTYFSSSTAMRASRRQLELLHEQNFVGSKGKIIQLSTYFLEKLKHLEISSCRGLINNVRGLGGIIGFTPLEGTLSQVASFIRAMFEQGALGFLCGHSVHSIRLLPPLGAMTFADIDVACSIIEQSAQIIGPSRSS